MVRRVSLVKSLDDYWHYYASILDVSRASLPLYDEGNVPHSATQVLNHLHVARLLAQVHRTQLLIEEKKLSDDENK
jgi:hypothetical protein